MKAGSPFRRANMLMATIQSLVTSGFAMSAISNLVGPYESRGKGKGRNRVVKTNHLRGGASKYTPHQGKREIARRLSRMEASCPANTL